MSDTEYALRRETDAARDLIQALRNSGEGDDAELVADTIEGETNLREAIGVALEEIDEWTVLHDGLEAKIARDQTRLSIIDKRVDRVRAAIERALIASELPMPLQLPTATISLSKRKPQAVIDDEALIPARFFTQPEPPAPKLDKKALAAALAEGTLPGAHLDNGSVSLTVRRK